MSDFDHNLHAFRSGVVGTNSGGGGAQGGDGIANVVDSPEIIFKGLEKAPGWLAKVSGVPGIPINFGEVSAFSGLETGQEQDWGSKKINQAAASISTRGGTLYNMIFAPLIKDGAIKDLTDGVGGGGFLEAPDFGAASASFASSAFEPMDIGGSGNFEALGGLPPPPMIEGMAVSAPSRGDSHAID